MGFVNGYDNELSHLIEAGSDFFMMPSLFEPCGLNQLYSLAYGTLPIVRETGGLKDTVVGLAPDHGNVPPPWTSASKNTRFATGISFIHPDNQGCYWALKQAVTLYLDYPQLYRQMQQQAMRQLFTWEQTAGTYEILFKKLLKNHTRNLLTHP
jgi:starch synthase